jgi:hypothetical protein
MSREEEAKFMNTFRRTRFYDNYRDRERWRPNTKTEYTREPFKPKNSDEKPDVQTQLNEFNKAQKSTNLFVKETF